MIPGSQLLRMAATLALVALLLGACAYPSDEERCRGGGGIWKGDSCEYSSG
jgi:hypothetical protein